MNPAFKDVLPLYDLAVLWIRSENYVTRSWIIGTRSIASLLVWTDGTSFAII